MEAWVGAAREMMDRFSMVQLMRVTEKQTKLKMKMAKVVREPVRPSDPDRARKMEGSLWFGSGALDAPDLVVLIYVHGGGFCIGAAGESAR
jgi:acetyl esterase/lipase